MDSLLKCESDHRGELSSLIRGGYRSLLTDDTSIRSALYEIRKRESIYKELLSELIAGLVGLGRSKEADEINARAKDQLFDLVAVVKKYLEGNLVDMDAVVQEDNRSSSAESNLASYHSEYHGKDVHLRDVEGDHAPYHLALAPYPPQLLRDEREQRQPVCSSALNTPARFPEEMSETGDNLPPLKSRVSSTRVAPTIRFLQQQEEDLEGILQTLQKKCKIAYSLPTRDIHTLISIIEANSDKFQCVGDALVVKLVSIGSSDEVAIVTKNKVRLVESSERKVYSLKEYAKFREDDESSSDSPPPRASLSPAPKDCVPVVDESLAPGEAPSAERPVDWERFQSCKSVHAVSAHYPLPLDSVALSDQHAPKVINQSTSLFRRHYPSEAIEPERSSEVRFQSSDRFDLRQMGDVLKDREIGISSTGNYQFSKSRSVKRESARRYSEDSSVSPQRHLSPQYRRSKHAGSPGKSSRWDICPSSPTSRHSAARTETKPAPFLSSGASRRSNTRSKHFFQSSDSDGEDAGSSFHKLRGLSCLASSKRSFRSRRAPASPFPSLGVGGREASTSPCPKSGRRGSRNMTSPRLRSVRRVRRVSGFPNPESLRRYRLDSADHRTGLLITEDRPSGPSRDDDQPGISKADQEFLDIVDAGIFVNKAGHIEIPLPFKKNNILPDNGGAVFLRTKNTLRRIQSNPAAAIQCAETICEYVNAGHVGKLLPHGESEKGLVYYINVCPVFQEKSREKPVCATVTYIIT